MLERENEKFGKYKDNSSLEAAFNEARRNEVTGTFGHLLMKVSGADSSLF